jgi:hypothetical protein
MNISFIQIIRLLWEFPQVILSGFFFVFLSSKIKDFKEIGSSVITYAGEKWGGISLGPFIFICEKLRNERTEKHEYGHSIQSMILGPLYLPIIGIPSFLHASLFSLYCLLKKKLPKRSYYSFYTEKWADKLGKVKR